MRSALGTPSGLCGEGGAGAVEGDPLLLQTQSQACASPPPEQDADTGDSSARWSSEPPSLPLPVPSLARGGLVLSSPGLSCSLAHSLHSRPQRQHRGPCPPPSAAAHGALPAGTQLEQSQLRALPLPQAGPPHCWPHGPGSRTLRPLRPLSTAQGPSHRQTTARPRSPPAPPPSPTSPGAQGRRAHCGARPPAWLADGTGRNGAAERLPPRRGGGNKGRWSLRFAEVQCQTAGKAWTEASRMPPASVPGLRGGGARSDADAVTGREAMLQVLPELRPAAHTL